MIFLKIKWIDVNEEKSEKKYQAIELFAGVGGMSLGLEKANIDTIAFIEKDKIACQTLRKNRPNWNVIENDITKINKEEMYEKIGQKEVDIVTGGFPCQAFSTAGKRLGIEDTRGTLFYYFADVVRNFNPKMFVAENVKGLLNHNKGETLKTIVAVFESLGYNVHVELFNSFDYEVAQKRERVFIFGKRKDLEDFIFLPEKANKKVVLREALKNVPSSLGMEYSQKKKEVLDLVPPGGNWRSLSKEVAKNYMGKSYESGGGKTGYAKRLSWEQPSVTLTCSPAQKQTERCHPDETRPLTVREYARIQSFPDEWFFCGSVTAQYRGIGNAVPCLLAFYIMKSVVLTLEKSNQT